MLTFVLKPHSISGACCIVEVHYTSLNINLDSVNRRYAKFSVTLAMAENDEGSSRYVLSVGRGPLK